MLYNPNLPTILDCGYFKFSSKIEALSSERIVRDYEIDYNVSGNRTMILDGTRYDIMPNTVVFKYPGQVVQSTGNFDMYTLTLQLTGSKKPQKNIRDIADSEIQSTIKSDFFSPLLPYFSPMHYSEIANDYIKITKIYSIPGQERECQSTLSHLLYLLFADAIAKKINHNVDSSVVETAVAYMESNYQKSSLKLGDIAKSVNISESYLIRLFKAETGFTPKDYLNSIRLKHAKWYVTYTSDPVYTISYLCGFDNPQYFISKFKAAFGKTPQAYRKNETDSNPTF